MQRSQSFRTGGEEGNQQYGRNRVLFVLIQLGSRLRNGKDWKREAGEGMHMLEILGLYRSPPDKHS